MRTSKIDLDRPFDNNSPLAFLHLSLHHLLEGEILLWFVDVMRTEVPVFFVSELVFSPKKLVITTTTQKLKQTIVAMITSQ